MTKVGKTLLMLSATAFLACGNEYQEITSIPNGPAQVSSTSKTLSGVHLDPSRHELVRRGRIEVTCVNLKCRTFELANDVCFPPRPCPRCPVGDPRRDQEIYVLSEIERTVLDPSLKAAVLSLSLGGTPTRPRAPASLLDKAQLAAHLVADADLGAGLSDSAQDELATLLERWAVEAR